jgi:hypothetical protein
VLAGGLAAACLALLGFAESGPGQTLLRDAGLTSASPSYSSISFAYPSALPATVADSASFRAPFDVHNASSRPQAYRWRAAVAGSTIAAGRARLPANATFRFNPKLSLSPCNGRVRVNIRIAGSPRDAIGFWTRCAAGSGSP